jgi:RNA-directed DNA polymerase
MTVKALMPVLNLNLVVPLAHKATDMRTTDTTDSGRDRSGAISLLIGHDLRQGDVDSTAMRSTTTAMRGTRTSTTATRTSTTRASSSAPCASADSDLLHRVTLAYLNCRRHKRNSTSALAFEAHLERNVCDLTERLANGSYRPGRSTCFVITRPKPREVWAGSFPDRVVHHLVYDKIAARFINSFTADTCACIPGRGTLYGAKRLEGHVRSLTQNWTRPGFYLKCDCANFFVSIKKSVLLDQLAAKVHEPWWMQLTEVVLMHDPRSDVEVRGSIERLDLVPPHKSLFNAPDGHGLPIGNLSSQFFANVLLNDLDQFVKHRLRARHYVRYVDDFIILDESPQRLNAMLREIESFLLERLCIRLNPSKTILQPIDRGIDFVGHVIKPWSRTTRSRTVNAAVKRIETLPDDEVFGVGNSYLGLLGQASHPHTDQARLAKALMKRGHCIKSDLTKAYRKATTSTGDQP